MKYQDVSKAYDLQRKLEQLRKHHQGLSSLMVVSINVGCHISDYDNKIARTSSGGTGLLSGMFLSPELSDKLSQTFLGHLAEEITKIERALIDMGITP